MMTSAIPWAVAGREILGIPYEWWGPVALGAFIVAGIIFSFRLKREERAEKPATPDEMLAALHASYAAGQMDAAEFQRVRDSITRVAEGKPLGSAKHAGRHDPAPVVVPPAAGATSPAHEHPAAPGEPPHNHPLEPGPSQAEAPPDVPLPEAGLADPKPPAEF